MDGTTEVVGSVTPAIDTESDFVVRRVLPCDAHGIALVDDGLDVGGSYVVREAVLSD